MAERGCAGTAVRSDPPEGGPPDRPGLRRHTGPAECRLGNGDQGKDP